MMPWLNDACVCVCVCGVCVCVCVCGLVGSMMKGMDKDSMKSMAKMAAQMQPQMKAMQAAGGASSSGSGGSGGGGGPSVPGMPAGMGDMANMDMDKGLDMMQNMSPEMVSPYDDLTWLGVSRARHLARTSEWPSLAVCSLWPSLAVCSLWPSRSLSAPSGPLSLSALCSLAASHLCWLRWLALAGSGWLARSLARCSACG
jgi:hypothetical protein